jgi:hypothetical protein
MSHQTNLEDEMKIVLSVLTVGFLSACASSHQRVDSPPPVVDKSEMSQEQIVMFSKDEKYCRKLQVKAMPFSLFEALSAPDVHQFEKDREAKASTIMRNCLQQKGHNVLY